MNSKVPVVCLVGSTKFKALYLEAAAFWTMLGFIVVTCHIFGHADKVKMDTRTKERLDELHRAKVDLADLVYVINPDGYVGKSTADEIDYARSKHKPILYGESMPCGSMLQRWKQ